jgi:MFS superfamily sulfate permease-like transporter
VLRSGRETGAGEADSARAAVGYGQTSPFRPAREEPWLSRIFPVVGGLRGYRAASARRDAVAGVTVAALAIPSAMAYAEVAGVSPVNGLYALLLPAVAYALFGSSRQLSVGPEGSLATLVAAAVLPLAAVIIELLANPALDVTSSEMLEQLTTTLRSAHIDVALADLRQPVIDMAKRTGLLETLGEDRIFLTVADAVRTLGAPAGG